MQYNIDNIPYIKIVAMSSKAEGFDKSPQEVQEDFFNIEVRRTGIFHFNTGIEKDAPENVLLLFKFKKQLIATALLDQVEIASSQDGEFENRMIIKKDSINLITPIVPIEEIGDIAKIERNIITGRVWNKISDSEYMQKVIDFVNRKISENSVGIINENITLNQFKEEFNKETGLLEVINQIRKDNEKIDNVNYGRREHKTLLDAAMMIILGYDNRTTKNKVYVKHVVPYETTWEQNAAVWLNNNGNDNTISADNKEDIRNIDRDNITLGMLSQEIQKFKSINTKNIQALESCINDIVDKTNSFNIKEEVNNYMENSVFRKINELTKDSKQIILTGSPGTGKTYNVKKYVEEKCVEQAGNKEDAKKYYKFVQFHTSYDYSDFVEGLRPAVIEGKEDNSFVRLDGIFKDFCRYIVEENNKDSNYNTSKNYYFIIDEINRADLSKVFGELMYGLEEDYRGPENAFDTQYKNLPTYIINENGKAELIENDCFKDGFYIPENLIIIGTMNDIDRSVETFDFALRRRFRWVEINANDVMEDALKEIRKDNTTEEIEDLIESAKAMNEVISSDKKIGLNKSFHIGPAYFKKGEKSNIWNTKVEPILYEYCRGRKPEDTDNFIENCRKAFFNRKFPENKENNTEEN